MRQNLEILKGISSLLRERQPPGATLESALENLLALSGTEAGLLTLLPSVNSPEPLTVRRGLPEDLVTLFAPPHQKNSALFEALEKDEHVSLDDMLRSDTSGNFAEIFRREDLHFFVLYPVRSADRLSGALGLASQRSDPIAERQNEYIQTALEVLGGIISNFQLREHASKLCDDVVALQEMNKIISQSLKAPVGHQPVSSPACRRIKPEPCRGRHNPIRPRRSRFGHQVLRAFPRDDGACRQAGSCCGGCGGRRAEESQAPCVPAVAIRDFCAINDKGPPVGGLALQRALPCTGV